jgi:cytidylate kinase
MAVITISRQFGAGGRTLGETLAKRLGYRFVNEDMIRDVAKKVGVSSKQVRAFEKDGGSKLLKFMDTIVSRGFIDRLVSEKYGYVDDKSYVPVVKALIEEIYEKGNAVIIGRGSQYILKDHENTLHLLLVADLEHRIRFMMDKYKLSEDNAQKVIKRADQIRANFLCLFSEKASHNDPLSYDLVVNMNRVNMEKAIEIVVGLVS